MELVRKCYLKSSVTVSAECHPKYNAHVHVWSLHVHFTHILQGYATIGFPQIQLCNLEEYD